MEDDNNYLGFIQLNRSQKLLNFIKRRNTAFVLLTLIAVRARRTHQQFFDDLKIGDAYIGDYKSYGVSENVYRADKKFLEKFGIATFKPTTKGTIARIIDTSIFDINAEEVTDEPTNNQRPINGQPTTNNKKKNDKKKNIFTINTKNQILKDPDFVRYKEIYHDDGDTAVRAKMNLLPILEQRYPNWKYQREWVEAQSALRTS